MASVKFLESNSQLEKQIRKALADEINKTLKPQVTQLETKLKPVFRSALQKSPEINSLSSSSGTLRLEFGLDSDPSAAIINAVIESLNVEWVKVNPTNFSGGLIVTIQPSDFNNLLTLPQGNQSIIGGSLPWLSWLLTLGDTVIITGYGVEFGSFPNTRTGQAKMSTKFAPYKVNSAFSGTIDDNFITRAIEKTTPEVEKIIRRML